MALVNQLKNIVLVKLMLMTGKETVLNWNSFLQKNALKNFLTENKLEFEKNKEAFFMWFTQQDKGFPISSSMLQEESVWGDNPKVDCEVLFQNFLQC